MMNLQKRLSLEDIYRTYIEIRPHKPQIELEILSDLKMEYQPIKKAGSETIYHTK